jgi:hypothetical protein
MSYRREVRGADESITNAIDSHAQPEQRKHDDALTARPRPKWANGTEDQQEPVGDQATGTRFNL